MADIRKQYEVKMEVKFEPLQPKVADKLPNIGKELMVIDINEIVMGELEK